MKKFFVGPSGFCPDQDCWSGHYRLPLGSWLSVIFFWMGLGMLQSAAAEYPLEVYEVIEPNAVGAEVSWEDEDAIDEGRISKRPAMDGLQRRERTRLDRIATPRDARQRGRRDVEQSDKVRQVSRQFADDVFEKSGGVEQCVPVTETRSAVVQCFKGPKRRPRIVKVPGYRYGANSNRPCGITAINVNDLNDRRRGVTLPTSNCR